MAPPVSQIVPAKPLGVGLLTSIVANGTTAFLIIMAMTLGLIVPRMLFERVSSSYA
jgi:hypothetical protein